MNQPILEIIDGDMQGMRFTITHDGFSLGRAEICDICMPHPSVSMLHCRFGFTVPGRLVVTSESLTKMTKINKRPIKQGTLFHDDLLHVGIFTFRCILESHEYETEALDLSSENQQGAVSRGKEQGVGCREQGDEVSVDEALTLDEHQPDQGKEQGAEQGDEVSVDEALTMDESLPGYGNVQLTDEETASLPTDLLKALALPTTVPKPTDVFILNSTTRELGAYTQLEILAQGAQTVWYKAWSTNTRKIVAIKLFDRTISSSETNPLRQLEHPNIVRYLDAFVARNEHGDLCRALVTEYLEGQILKEMLTDYPYGMPWTKVFAYLDQCLAGLVYAQRRRIIHRNIKLTNIMITRDQTLKLLNFSINPLTYDEIVAGGYTNWCFDYMAPDFIREGPDFRGDEQSDIFSLFACIYELLTGDLPFASRVERLPMEFAQRWQGTAPAVSYQHIVFMAIPVLKPFIELGLAAERKRRYRGWDDVRNACQAVRRAIEKRG